MPTFAEHIRNTTHRVKEEEKDRIFKYLTPMYYPIFKKRIEEAAKNGLSMQEVNLTVSDFNTNCKGLGNWQDVLKVWLDEVIMNKDDDKYLPVDDLTHMRYHFHGIKWRWASNTKLRFIWD